MKITALVENLTKRDDLKAEHGLSLLIEANGRTVLFDSGQTDALAANVQALGIDLSTVDTAVLSHGHFDHAGGFPSFLQVNETAPIYARTGCARGHYREERYIGVDPALLESGRMVLSDDDRALGDGFSIVSFAGCTPREPIDSDGLEEGTDGGGRVLEVFSHEQYLIVEEGDARVLISGCSHRGIVNIMEWSAALGLTHVIGGFHLMNVDPADERIERIAQALLAYPVSYRTCHCTGSAQYEQLATLMGARLGYLSTGDVIEI